MRGPQGELPDFLERIFKPSGHLIEAPRQAIELVSIKTPGETNI